jgi:hypothetical protein
MFKHIQLLLLSVQARARTNCCRLAGEGEELLCCCLCQPLVCCHVL